MKRKYPPISRTFAVWLSICLLAAFAATTAAIYWIQTRIAEQDARELLRMNIRDVYLDIVDASNENILELTRMIIGELERSDQEQPPDLKALAHRYGVSEINIVSDQGIILDSTDESFIGFDMASGQQSAEFLVLLEGQEAYAQSYQSVSYDDSVFRKYGAVALASGGFVQVGYDSERFQQDIRTEVTGATRNRHIGESGGIIICGENWQIVSDRNGYEGQSITAAGLSQDALLSDQGEMFTASVYGEPSYCMYLSVEGYYAISVLPRAEVIQTRNVSMAITLAMEGVILVLLLAVIYVLLKRQIADNIRRINISLAHITGGDLEEQVCVDGNEEFVTLSAGINTTVSALKQSIADAKARIDQELEFARRIQQAALPSVFPPYPDRQEFAIYASMDPAKEVGGDFYDFYLLSENTLAILIADVSGKGIPAAMFMMQIKTLLKSLAESKLEVQEIFRLANDKLCQSNEADMFVTVWMGLLDLKTGLLRYANAGHNPPLLRHAGGSFAFVKAPADLVLAGMEGVPYRAHQLQLQPGDMLYLYTDGVTEAMDSNDALFGADRLVNALDQVSGNDVQTVCTAVKESVSAFVGDAPQFDDITMLCLRYLGASVQKELLVRAVPENLEQVIAFVEGQLARCDCPPKILMQLTLAVEEIFINISSYAYDPEIGSVTLRMECREGVREAAITFTDQGRPYDPLQKEDPDVTLSAAEREIGGLGIFLVKETMDDVQYAYTAGRNILRIVKRW